MASIPSDILKRRGKPVKCRNNFKIDTGILYYRNVLPKVRNHGRYVQEVSRRTWRRREYLCPAMLAQQDLKTLSSNLLDYFFPAVLVMYVLQKEYCLLHKLSISYIIVFYFHIVLCY